MIDDKVTENWRTISSMINNMEFNAREVAEKLSNNHPTQDSRSPIDELEYGELPPPKF